MDAKTKREYIKAVNKISNDKISKKIKGIMSTAINNSKTLDDAMARVARDAPEHVNQFLKIIGVE